MPNSSFIIPNSMQIISFIFVLFGATGNLAKNKVVPSLFGLFKRHELPSDFTIYAFSRRPYSDNEYYTWASGEVGDIAHDPQWQDFLSHISYHQGEFTEENSYHSLVTKIGDMVACEDCIKVLYLATPPDYYETILANIGLSGLAQGVSTRIAIEKPFGRDGTSAEELDRKLGENFKEDQIYRIDHYLAKDTVQNMLIFRFANSIFAPIWTSEYIDHIQITWMEKKDIQGRGAFFDATGLLRDVAQNHLLQLFAAVAMEQPKSFSKDDVRDVRAKAIKSLRDLTPDEVSAQVIRGQYEGYRQEPDVAPDSMTETYVAMKFFADIPSLEGVPIYMRAGKAMDKDHVVVSVVFRQTCHLLFKEIGCPEEGNILKFHIQPDEGITVKTIVKSPGTALALETVNLHFGYKEGWGQSGVEAYEKILVDILAGDQMLFSRSDELAHSWEFIDKILAVWSFDFAQDKSKSDLKTYAKGSSGPKEATELIERDGRKWL